MTLAKPQATYSEDEYRFLWPEQGVEMVLERFVESKDDIRCELVVHYDHPMLGGKVYSGRLLLIGPNSLRDVVSALGKADPNAAFWQPMVQQARDMAKERYRVGDPATDLRIREDGPPSRYLVRPFLLDRGITVFFGSEESAKSLFTLLLSTLVASGSEIAGFTAEVHGPVALLDWEDDASVHQERLRALCLGAGIDISTVHIEHKRMVASLAESVREVRQWLGSIHARLVIVDSLGMACGGDPNDASLMMRTMIAARSLDVPVAGIHHLPKDAKDKNRPYGSVYAAAEARMTWLVEKDEEANYGHLRIALTNRKSNRTSRHKRQSFQFDFTVDEDTEELTRIDVKPLSFSDAVDVGTGAGQKWILAKALKAGPLTIDQVVVVTGISQAVCRVLLNRHKTFFVKTPDDAWALIADDVDERNSYDLLRNSVTDDDADEFMSRNNYPKQSVIGVISESRVEREGGSRPLGPRPERNLVTEQSQEEEEPAEEQSGMNW